MAGAAVEEYSPTSLLRAAAGSLRTRLAWAGIEQGWQGGSMAARTEGSLTRRLGYHEYVRGRKT